MPSQIVVDASACVELLIGSSLATRIAGAIGDAQLIAPDILTAETLHALRGLERGGVLSLDRATLAVQRLRESSIVRIPTHPLIERIWTLRSDLTAYDSCYVALAQLLDCPLLSTDAKLAQAPGLNIAITLVG